MWQNYCNFTHLKRKKKAGEIVQVEQTISLEWPNKKWLVKQCKLNKQKLLLHQGIRPLYIYIYIKHNKSKRKIVVLEKKKNQSHQNGKMP